eukprot:8321531-Pyramimonas_sp.AAC.1
MKVSERSQAWRNSLEASTAHALDLSWSIWPRRVRACAEAPAYCPSSFLAAPIFSAKSALWRLAA